jgi:DNA polymerase
MSVHTLHIDLESRSTVDLPKSGVYRYAADPTTDVWCAAYAVDDEPIGLWIPAGRAEAPLAVQSAVREGWQIIAHNAAFERVMWRGILGPRYGWPIPKLTQWRCTMACALAMSLPAALSNAAAVAGVEIGKDMGGRALMMQMAKPRRPRKGENPDGIYWFDDDARKQRLYAYCKNDVEVERKLHERLLPLSPSEQQTWWLDQIINDRGVYVDTALCLAALQIVDQAADLLDEEMREVTGGHVEKCSNVVRLAEWLRLRGWQTDGLDKQAIDELLGLDLPDHVRRALELRREAAKASVKKIEALLLGRSHDNRARGLLQFHAASTGRWAGRRFQPQNIKRPQLKEGEIDEAIEAVATGDIEVVRQYGEPLSVVGDCLRGMITAAKGRRIMAADFANIEGRILAWMAGEDWKLQAFRDYDAGTGPDLYILAWARSFGIPVEQVTKDQRQGGKVQELALGYEGGVSALQSMAAAYKIKLDAKTADEWKRKWRQAHPRVTDMWRDIEDAQLYAVQHPGKIVKSGVLAWRTAGSFLWMRLPSGRSICYPYPRIAQFAWIRDHLGRPRSILWERAVELERAGKIEITSEPRDVVEYQGQDSYTRKWGPCYAYGGLTTENADQGIASDILREAMKRLERRGYPIILTVHDEAVAEPAVSHGSLEEFEAIVCELPAWAEGLPIAASAWDGERYKKA